MDSVNASSVFGFLPDFDDQCTNDTFSCSDPVPPCLSPKGMHFSTLWTITQNYYSVCAEKGAWLFNTSKDSLSLTRQACHAIVGDSWTMFPKADIWSRLTTWKFPLIQLIASSPRPPLGFWVETLTVLHLAADPIRCLTDLLFKLESCQRRAIFWLQQTGGDRSRRFRVENDDTGDRMHKSLAIITESYSELSDEYGQIAQDALQRQWRESVANRAEGQAFLDECTTTAGALAADRATTFLPVIIAEAIFISVFFIDIIRLQSDSLARSTSTTFVNIEMHSIGFSALFFWLTSTVIITAVIGTSQTAEAVPRILRRFQRDLTNAGIDIVLPDVTLAAHQPEKRWCSGGVYTWQPRQRHRFSKIKSNAREEMRPLKSSTKISAVIHRNFLRVWPYIYTALPMTIFLCAIATGILMSAFVPPRGWTCRSFGELYFAIGWLLSYFLSIGISRLPERFWFATLFCKDLIITCAAAAWILVTQVGVYNRCDCYIGNDGLILPEQPDAYAELQRGLRVGGSFVTILVLGIVFQVVTVPALLWMRYSLAIEVFLQKDTGSVCARNGVDEQRNNDEEKVEAEVETREVAEPSATTPALSDIDSARSRTSQAA